MTTAAVVCEYNPFHNGHFKQFQQIRQAFGADTAILCIMSGNFVQRGEPAIFSKMVRAEAAMRCGANLVLELPVTCALSSAEGFAHGAVGILNRLHIIDYLCFGSERADMAGIWKTASVLLSPAFSVEIKKQLEQNVSFAVARCRALEKLGLDVSCVAQPNDILAVEYCKALQRLHSNIKPAVFLRQGSYHAPMPEPENPSASSLRAMSDIAQWAPFVPSCAAAVYENAPIYRRENGERAMLAVLRSLPDFAFETMPFGSEGLWRRFRRACRQESSVENIIDAVKSKRYARSRIARMCMCAYLGISQEQLEQSIPYVRVLALDQIGRQLLKRAHISGQIPILHAGTKSKESYFALETRCDNLFSLFAPQDQILETNMERKCCVIYKNK